MIIPERLAVRFRSGRAPSGRIALRSRVASVVIGASNFVRFGHTSCQVLRIPLRPKGRVTRSPRSRYGPSDQRERRVSPCPARTN